MKIETFFENFELFAEAPGAVARMRELVLELAMRGKLVVSGASSVQVQEFSDAKQSEFTTERNNENEPPYELPRHWEWQSLATVADCRASEKVSSESIKTKSWVLDLEDIDGIKGKIIHFSTFEDRNSLSTKAAFEIGDVLYGKLRPYLNKVVLAPKAGFCTTEIIPLRPTTAVTSEFLRYFLRSKSFLKYAAKKGYGMKMPRLGTKDLESAWIPLPPLAEQNRIVAKVDELMDLCDWLETQQQDRETRFESLSRASLDRFAEAPTPANLNFIFHKSYDVSPAELRKAILTLAVQGKLVAQDLSEETSKELIFRINKTLGESNGKKYDSVSENDAPFEIPDSWSWIRLGSISLKSESGWSPQCLNESREGSNWGVLKVSAVSWGVFKPEENKALPPGFEGRPECEVKAGDFLLSRANTEDLVARSVVVGHSPPQLMLSDKIVRFVFPKEIEKEFINLVNLSSFARIYYARNASGTSSSMKNIGREVMCNLPIPFPPLPEQRRIVARVNQLMAHVDQLESQLSESKSSGKNLLEALVAELAA
ncbi:MAG: restriction endonuclease subunit S [Fibrobacteria bacterium]